MANVNLKRGRRGLDRLQRSINVRFPNKIHEYAKRLRAKKGLDSEKAGWSMTINSMIQKCNNGENLVNLLDERMFDKLIGVQQGEIKTIYLDEVNIEFIMNAKEIIEAEYRPYKGYPWAWIIIAMLTYAAGLNLDTLRDMEEVKLPPIFVPKITIQ